MAATARLSRPLEQPWELGSHCGFDVGVTDRLLRGHSGTLFSSRVDELVDLALGLEPGDIAFDRVFMHFAE